MCEYLFEWCKKFYGCKKRIMRSFWPTINSRESREDIRLPNRKLDSVDFHTFRLHSPYMGGLWEAAIKFAKTHLRKIIGITPLSYVNIYTKNCLRYWYKWSMSKLKNYLSNIRWHRFDRFDAESLFNWSAFNFIVRIQ